MMLPRDALFLNLGQQQQLPTIFISESLLDPYSVNVPRPYHSAMASSIPDQFNPAAFDQESSSDDDFKSAVEFLTPNSHVSGDPIEITPSTAVNPIMMEDTQSQDLPSFSDSSDDENTIPPPETCDSNGKKRQWESLDSAFKAL